MSEIDRLRKLGVEVDAATTEKMKDPLWSIKSGLGYQYLSDDAVYLSRHRALSEARDFTSRAQLIDWMKHVIRPVFPFECGLLIFGRDVAGQIAIEHALSIDMPASYMAYVEQPQHKMHSPVLSSWDTRHVATVFHESDIKVEPAFREWHQQFVSAGFKNVVIDGAFDEATKDVTLVKLFNCTRRTNTGANFALSLFNTKVADCIHNTWKRIVEHEAEIQRRLPSCITVLTPKEIEVLQWIKMGKTNAEIGIILSNSPKTIKTHVEHILKKLNMPNRATLASIDMGRPS
jgi:DNA-binding CsgD family transcriptional regulator